MQKYALKNENVRPYHRNPPKGIMRVRFSPQDEFDGFPRGAKWSLLQGGHLILA